MDLNLDVDDSRLGRDGDIAVNRRRLCRFALHRSLERSSPQYVEWEAVQTDLNPGLHGERLPRASARFDDNFELCCFLGLPFLDETRADMAKSLSVEQFKAAPHLDGTVWAPATLDLMGQQELSTHLPPWWPRNRQLQGLFPKLPNELDAKDIVVHALELHEDLLSADAENRLATWQLAVVYQPGAFDLDDQGTLHAWEEGDAGLEHRLSLLIANKKHPFPLLCTFRGRWPLQLGRYTVALLGTSLTPALRVASALGSPAQHCPWAFWPDEVLRGCACEIPSPSCLDNSPRRELVHAKCTAARLNQSQFDVVAGAVARLEGAGDCSRVQLVQGPPGTGKTQTLAVLLGLFLSFRQRALVCAASNTAVKELAERVIKEHLLHRGRRTRRGEAAPSLEDSDSGSEAGEPGVFEGPAPGHRTERTYFEGMLRCLEPGCWLDDACIAWYFRRLAAVVPDEHVLLVDPAQAELLKDLEDWPDLVELFLALRLLERHLILLPVSDASGGGLSFGGSHWSLLVLRRVLGGWEFSSYDSVESRPNDPHALRLATHINALLEDSANALVEDPPHIAAANVPVQANGFDCGIFALAFATRLVEAFPEAPEAASLQEPVDALTWRRELQDLIRAEREGGADPRRSNDNDDIWLPRGPLPRSGLTVVGYRNVQPGKAPPLSNTSLAEIVLVANEKTARLDWDCVRSAIFLNHRKKRIKRVARFWLGEGFGESEPFLEQPPWVEEGMHPLGSLLDNPQQAWHQWRARPSEDSGGSPASLAGAWQDVAEQRLAERSLLQFVRFALRSLLRVAERQLAQLEADVPPDETKPWAPAQGEDVFFMDAMRDYRAVLWLRKKLRAFQAALAAMVSQMLASSAADLGDVTVSGGQPCTSPASDPPAAPDANATRRTSADSLEAFQAVLAARNGLVVDLVNLLNLQRGGESGCEVPEAELRRAKKRLWLLVHPDKVAPELRGAATEASTMLDDAWRNVERCCRSGHVPQEEEGTSGATCSPPEERHTGAFAAFTSELATLQAAAEELRKASFVVRVSTHLQHALLAHSTLIFCTVSAAGRLLVQREAVPLLVLDEACQCTEAGSLVPLHGGMERMILVGDPAQLPATVVSKLAERSGYGRSTYERLLQLRRSPELLNEQYRMQPDILEWPNETFYAGQVSTGTPVFRRHASWWLDESDAAAETREFLGTMRLFDTSDEDWLEQPAGTSVCNPGEAQFIIALLEHSVSSFRASDTLQIGVITPYKAQQLLIQELLAESAGQWLKAHTRVSTVDSFQGQECHIVAISTVRTGETIGFVRNERRLNVAITRAMLKCWVVGHLSALEESEKVWAMLGDHARARGWVKRAALPSQVPPPQASAPAPVPAAPPDTAPERACGSPEEPPLVPAGSGRGAVWESQRDVPLFAEQEAVCTEAAAVARLPAGERCLQAEPCVFSGGGVLVMRIEGLCGLRGWVAVDDGLSLLNECREAVANITAADPFDLFFSHDSISSRFRNGRLLDETIRALLERLLTPADFPPLDVTRHPEDGKLYSLSNRRLYTFRVAANLGVIDNVPIKLHQFDAPFLTKPTGKRPPKWQCSFTTPNGGTCVEVTSDFTQLQWPRRPDAQRQPHATPAGSLELRAADESGWS